MARSKADLSFDLGKLAFREDPGVACECFTSERNAHKWRSPRSQTATPFVHTLYGRVCWLTHTCVPPSGAVLNSIDTGSQVCSLLWSKHNKEICSSHGFSENQLCLWNYPSMTKIQELKGHTARVLHMAQSPDGSSVVSAAADETLRFWQIFGSPPSSKKGGAGILGGESGSRFGMFSSIR